MPDRQRHSGLSDTFARLFAVRFRTSPPPAGRRRAGGPAGAGGTGPTGGTGPAGAPWSPAPEPVGPPWPEDPTAVTMDLGRSPWQTPDSRSGRADRPDPMADTMRLRRVTEAEPVTEAATSDTGTGGDAGIAGVGAEADAGAEADTDTAAYPDAATVAGVGTGAATEAPEATEATEAAEAAEATEPTHPLSVRDLLQRHRRRFTIGAAGVVVLGVLLALPPVRTQLRDSFTQLPKPYTALYFTSPPQVDGTVLTVPVSVHAVNTGATPYSVRVWTVDAKGQADDSGTADLRWDGQALRTVVTLPVNPAAVYVWVSLGGSTETLHYKIAVS